MFLHRFIVPLDDVILGGDQKSTPSIWESIKYLLKYLTATAFLSIILILHKTRNMLGWECQASNRKLYDCIKHYEKWDEL